MQGTGLLATVVRHSLSAQAWRTATHQQELVCRSGRSAAATPGQRPDPLCAKNAGGRLPTGAGSRVARAAPTAPWASPERATALRGERTTCNQPNNNDWFKDILEHKLGKFQVYDCTQVRSRTWRKDMYMRSAVLLCPPGKLQSGLSVTLGYVLLGQYVRTYGMSVMHWLDDGGTIGRPVPATSYTRLLALHPRRLYIHDRPGRGGWGKGVERWGWRYSKFEIPSPSAMFAVLTATLALRTPQVVRLRDATTQQQVRGLLARDLTIPTLHALPSPYPPSPPPPSPPPPSPPTPSPSPSPPPLSPGVPGWDGAL